MTVKKLYSKSLKKKMKIQKISPSNVLEKAKKTIKKPWENNLQ